MNTNNHSVSDMVAAADFYDRLYLRLKDEIAASEAGELAIHDDAAVSGEVLDMMREQKVKAMASSMKWRAALQFATDALPEPASYAESHPSKW